VAKTRQWVTSGQLRWWYRRFNRAYWGGRLPMPWQMVFRRMDDLGHTLFWKVSKTPDVPEIAMNSRLKHSLCLCLVVMLHEMAHVARPRAGHGKAHKSELRRLMRLGAYDNLL